MICYLRSKCCLLFYLNGDIIIKNGVIIFAKRKHTQRTSFSSKKFNYKEMFTETGLKPLALLILCNVLARFVKTILKS